MPPSARLRCGAGHAFHDVRGDVAEGDLFLGAAGLIFRVLQLWVQDGLMAGVAWALKIITDPFHDVKMYYRAPFYLAKGEFLDPMDHVKSH